MIWLDGFLVQCRAACAGRPATRASTVLNHHRCYVCGAHCGARHCDAVNLKGLDEDWKWVTAKMRCSVWMIRVWVQCLAICPWQGAIKTKQSFCLYFGVSVSILGSKKKKWWCWQNFSEHTWELNTSRVCFTLLCINGVRARWSRLHKPRQLKAHLRIHIDKNSIVQYCGLVRKKIHQRICPWCYNLNLSHTSSLLRLEEGILEGGGTLASSLLAGHVVTFSLFELWSLCDT